ncbi:MAG: biotin/lipoyl-binding protein [Microbacterium sp.]
MVVWRRIILPILLVVVLGVAAASLAKIAFFPDVQETAAVTPEAGIADPVVDVQRGSIVNALSLDGTVARDDAYAVRSKVDGTVDTVHVSEGATVAKDQVLFTVLQTYPERYVDILAPEAGEVSGIALVTGQATSIGGETLKLTPSRYHLQATVQPVQLYRLVNAPGEAQVTIAGGPAPFACTGVRVQVGDDGTASVRCAVPADQTVFAGLPAKLDLALGQVDDALVIPVTAVQGGAETGVVWVDAGAGEPAPREVRLGISDGENVEVVEGLAEGDSIRQFVPGFAAPVQQNCWTDPQGNEMCESGSSW